MGSEPIAVGVRENIAPGIPLPDFDWQCRTHRVRLVGYCKTLVRSRDEAEDLAQRVFIRSLRYYHTSYDPNKSSFFSWCCLQARHILSDDHRHPKPTPSSLDDLHDQHEYEPLDTFDITEKSREEAAMQDFLDGLSDREKEFLRLVDPATRDENEAVRKAALRLGITPEMASAWRRALRERFYAMQMAGRL